MCHQTHQKLPNQDGQSSRIPDARYIPPNPELLNVDGSDVRNYDPVRDSVHIFLINKTFLEKSQKCVPVCSSLTVSYI